MTQEEQILMNNINKRFKTTMIGALARFEDSFGYLWEDENNPNSENFNILWERVRDDILNNGNNYDITNPPDVSIVDNINIKFLIKYLI